jgi:hypothetical protein
MVAESFHDSGLTRECARIILIKCAWLSKPAIAWPFTKVAFGIIALIRTPFFADRR